MAWGRYAYWEKLSGDRYGLKDKAIAVGWSLFAACTGKNWHYPSLYSLTADELLKECATVLAELLSMIFQRSFETGTLPADWKTANIVGLPIVKQGDRTDRVIYRPVSLTSVACKIMESII